MSLRYYAGYSLVLVSRLFRSVLAKLFWIASFPERVSVIVWTPREIDRYARADWNSWEQVRNYAMQNEWLNATEQALVERYFSKDGELLNLACGAGREAVLLARQGLRVTACDWSPRMMAEARRRAQEANLPVRFAVADLMDDLPYTEHAFDYLLLANIAYSYLFPQYRRLRFLRQAYSILRPGGVFIVSLACAGDGLPGEEKLQRLFMKLRQVALFNRHYEPGDSVRGSFVHFFRPEELRQEFEEARFFITDGLWNEGYAVLTKG
jgi:SAM-dependent methyltransferase